MHNIGYQRWAHQCHFLRVDQSHSSGTVRAEIALGLRLLCGRMRSTRSGFAPLAAALHITPVSIPIDGTKPEEHVRAVAEAVRRTAHNGDVVLVVDHQSTLRGIIAALGARRPPTMCDVEFRISTCSHRLPPAAWH